MNELKELLNIVGLLDQITEYSLLHEHETQDSSPYLLAGQRILTLAREKKRRVPVKTQNLTVRLCDLNYSSLDPNPDLAKNQLRTYIQKFIKKNFRTIAEKECSTIGDIPFLRNWSSLYPSNHLEIENNSFNKHLAQEVSRSKTILTLKFNEKSFCLPASPRKRFGNNEYYFKSQPKQTIRIIHIERVLTEVFIMHWLNTLLLDASIDTETDAILKELVRNYTKPLCGGLWAAEGLPDWFIRFLEDNGYQKEDDRYILCSANEITSKTEFSLKDFEGYEAILRIVSFAYGGIGVQFEELFRDSGVFVDPPYYLWDYAYETLRYFVKDIQNRREEQHYRKKLEGMVARAYTTKRNIPAHILQEMKISKLNQYFGIVEYDEDVDLSLVNAVIEEFIKLNRIYFHGFQCKDTAMRFRKLGRHKALGLYYPFLNTMVVDFRSPSSFVHEYFHMLDDVLGDVSLKSGFFRIADRYQFILSDYVKKEEEKGNILFSKHSKYNLNYYLQKCEIFARCGEIHLFRNLHVVSSLLKHEDTHSFAYPDDKELNHLIEEYYTPLLDQLGSKKVMGGEHNEEALYITDH